MNHQIRFCKSFDGVRLAYAITGEGPPLVKAPHWLTHLEHEWQSPIWKPWIESLSRSHTLLRMDERGCGLSDWKVSDISFEAMVRDLEAVVDAAGFARFALMGHSQGGAIAVEYAARHPERVSHLVLLGAFMRGGRCCNPSPQAAEEMDMLLKLIELGWGRDDPSYRQMFAMQFLPGGTREEINSFSELQRKSATPENAVRIASCLMSVDISESVKRVQCPTLILHARDDRRIPFSQALQLAESIPGALLVPLESINHILLPHEPAFRLFFDELSAFLPSSEPIRGKSVFPDLTPRELDVLEHIARGLDNTQIAAHLGLSEKTVRNHITRVFDKVGVENRSKAIVLARNLGLGIERPERTSLSPTQPVDTSPKP